MRNIVIIADSTCDLSKDLIDKYQIRILPLGVTFPDNPTKIYQDGIDINSEMIYEHVDKTGILPKTSAINVATFMQVFEEELNKGNDIFYTGIGSGLSSSYNNARLAAQEFDASRIAIVDSQNLSTGVGIIACRAGKMRDEGKTLEEIRLEAERIVPLISTKFCIDRLDYLHKGGRCSGMTKIVAHAFKIHPVAHVKDNKLSVYKMPRGKYIKAVETQIDEFIEDLPYIDKDCIFITHSGNMEGIEYQVFDKMAQYVPKENLHITQAGSTISSHCGPKTIGLLYIVDKKN